MCYIRVELTVLVVRKCYLKCLHQARRASEVFYVKEGYGKKTCHGST